MLVARGPLLADSLDQIVAARCATVAIGEGVVEGDAAAALLFSDWAVLHPAGRLVIHTPAALAGAIWRLGGAALTCAAGGHSIGAFEALRLGLCDAVGDGADFLAGRSETALDAAAVLISRRGGATLERATFAWLFATGLPGEGLRAFLDKRRPRFGPE